MAQQGLNVAIVVACHSNSKRCDRAVRDKYFQKNHANCVVNVVRPKSILSEESRETRLKAPKIRIKSRFRTVMEVGGKRGKGKRMYGIYYSTEYK